MNEFLWVAMLLVNFAAILIVYRLFGKIGLFAWIPIATITANLQVLKTVELFGMTATLGNIIYATTFLVTDILSENYGRQEANRAVGIGFVSLVALVLLMNGALLFEPHASDFAQPHLQAIFTILPRITLASFVAYLISQYHDVWAYHFWKRRFPAHRQIWVRNNLSTIVSQLIDSALFSTLAFIGVFDLPVVLEIALTTFLFKVVVAVADTPLVYLAGAWKAKNLIRET